MKVEGMEEVSFKIIAAIGEAKTLIMTAITSANNQHFEQAREQLAEAKQKFVTAHNAHFDLIQKEASGEKVELGLLLVHAEDQLMTTSLLHEVVEQMVTMYETMYQLVQGKEN